MADRNDPFGRSTMLQPALMRIAFAGLAVLALWIGVAWAIALP